MGFSWARQRFSVVHSRIIMFGGAVLNLTRISLDYRHPRSRVQADGHSGGETVKYAGWLHGLMPDQADRRRGICRGGRGLMPGRVENRREGLTWHEGKIGSRQMKVARGSWAFLLLTILVGTAGGVLRADVIETKEGAHLVGHITKIADGKVTIDTEFAGEVAVLQKHIVRIETDGPVAVRLANGQRYDGRLSGASGTEQVAAAAGPVPASVTDIAAIWAAGAPDPATLSHWKFETGVDVAGKTGNHNQLGSSYSATATLTGPKDTLILSSNYYRQSTDGVKSADQLKAGADFSDNYSDRSSWYARDEAGFDHIKDLSLYDTLATGIGYDFIKEVEQKMTGRIGLAYRYEDYSGTGAQNLHTMALDLGLNQ